MDLAALAPFKRAVAQLAVNADALHGGPFDRALVGDLSGLAPEREGDLSVLHGAAQPDAISQASTVGPGKGSALLLKDERRVTTARGPQIHGQDPRTRNILARNRDGNKGEEAQSK